MSVLSIARLTKRIRHELIVHDVSLDIARGTVFGLLGRNGAGKSTLISCCLGLTTKTSGDVSFFGEPLRARNLARIAYVPEADCLDGWMTLRQHVELRRRSYPRFDLRLMNEMTDRFEIEPDRLLSRSSKGQRRSVALALAFAQRADLLFLDEPSSGLDPVMQDRLLDAIVTAASDGAAVFFSSHCIGHVEQAAERVGIMDRGTLELEADVDDLRTNRFVVEAIYDDGRLERIAADGDVIEVEARLRRKAPTTISRRAMDLRHIFLDTIERSK